MKYAALTFVAFLGIALLAMVARAGDEVPATQPAIAPTTQPVSAAINKFCTVHQDNPVDSRVPTVEYNGQTIGFCCEDCIPEFKKNPEKYMATLR